MNIITGLNNNICKDRQSKKNILQLLTHANNINNQNNNNNISTIISNPNINSPKKQKENLSRIRS